MLKDFDTWNARKKTTHFEGTSVFYHEREIWWCALGVNVGGEQDGTGKNFDRPVLVIKGFSADVLLCVALTGKKKEGKYYFYLGHVEDHESSAILSQVRLVDSKRLVKKIGTLDKKVFNELKTALKALMFG